MTNNIHLRVFVNIQNYNIKNKQKNNRYYLITFTTRARFSILTFSVVLTPFNPCKKKKNTFKHMNLKNMIPSCHT